MTWHTWGYEAIKKSRKPHKCTWCREGIERGSPYIRWRSKNYSDDPLAARMHPECEKAMHEWNDEFMPGEFRRGCICSRDDVPCEVCATKGVTE